MLVTLRREIIDPSLKSSFAGVASAAWIASEPADWAGLKERLRACAPAGGRIKFSWWPQAKAKKALAQGARGLVKAEGARSPWLEAEPLVWRDFSSPRLPTLDLTMSARARVPREWSQAWEQEVARRWVLSPSAAVEQALRDQGFGRVWALGFEHDATGPRHPANVAAARLGAWLAEGEKQALGESLPAAPARDGRRL